VFAAAIAAACTKSSEPDAEPDPVSAGGADSNAEPDANAGDGGVAGAGETESPRNAGGAGAGAGGEAAGGQSEGGAGAAAGAGGGGEPNEPEHPPLLDADGDGFQDSDDPAPHDATVPGDYSTPEAILDDPSIKAALAGAKAADAEVATHTERDVPDITGYYATADGGGRFVASGNGSDINRTTAGSEVRDTAYSDLTLDQAGVSFTGGAPVGFFSARGLMLRGSEGEISVYSRSKSVCTIGGANFAVFTIAITSATVNPTSGDWTNQHAVLVTVATQGTPTTACADSFAANLEVVGGWVASTVDLSSSVSAGQLDFMCKDEKKGYAPTEEWTNTQGEACTCTEAYAVSCE
jgi:hypothetical protein